MHRAQTLLSGQQWPISENAVIIVGHGKIKSVCMKEKYIYSIVIYIFLGKCKQIIRTTY